MTKIEFNIEAVPPGRVAESAPLPKLFTSTAMRHLAREYPQNSTDAAQQMLDGIMARMKYRFLDVARADLAPYGIETAIRHAEACEEPSVGKWDGGERLRVMTIEDSSGGLDGEVTASSNDIRSPLGKYLFAVGTGVSGKNGRANGRFGVGSMTGAFASRFRLMFVYSRRRDGTSIASARLSLPRHELDGQTYSSEARLGHIDENGIWHGILTGSEADALARVFGFDISPDYHGLSVAIVEPVNGISFESAVEAVICEQCCQIMEGFVGITVRDETDGRHVNLDAASIRDYMDGDDLAAIRASLRRRGRPFAYDPLDQASDAVNFLSLCLPAEPREVPGLSADVADERMRVDYLSGRPVSVKVASTALREDGGEASGWVTHYLKKLPEGRHGVAILVRDAIVNTRRTNGYISLTVSRGDDIATALGDCEDPQHANYHAANAQERGWQDVTDALALFLRGTDDFRRMLSDASAKSDRQSLAAFFPLPGRGVDAAPEGGGEGDGAEGEVIVPPESKFRLLSYKENRKAGTLTATLTPQARKLVSGGADLSIEFEIDYHKSQRGVGSFVESGGSIQAIDPTAEIKLSGSTVRAWGISEDFTVVVRDVDFNRDLEVTARVVEDDDAHQEAA